MYGTYTQQSRILFSSTLNVFVLPEASSSWEDWQFRLSVFNDLLFGSFLGIVLYTSVYDSYNK